jgi:hypothetical protein
MATVWTFGDSLTEAYSPTYKWTKKYIEWKGYTPKVYGNLVSEGLGYELKNLGKGGSDNYRIFETFCKTYPLIQDDDIVLIGWSSCLRFRMVDKRDEWKQILPNWDNYIQDIPHFSKNTANEILVNRSSVKYIEEVNSWINFINSACNTKKIIHWTHFHKELNAFHFLEGIERIRSETNGLIDDAHFSENGQKQLADELLKIIEIRDTGIKKNKLI